MKTIAFSLLLLTMIAGLSKAQNVEIPDTAFLYALIDDGVDANGDSLISYAEAEAITSLDIGGGGDQIANEHCMIFGKVSSLKGIEAFSRLDSLICSDNLLDTIDLSSNTSITYLKCNSPKLTKLDISGNIKLEYLDCSSCIHKANLTTLDISNCPALKVLLCFHQPLTSLDISNNTALEVLSIFEMSSLFEVCVWSEFPAGVDVYTEGSPNVYFTTGCTVGLSEYQQEKLNIYPNPANDLLTIETTNPESLSIEIHTLNGQLLYNDKMEGPTLQIDLSSFQKGLYFITVRSRDYVRTEKLIKQ